MNASKSSKICRICCNQKLNDLICLLESENKPIVKKLCACADISIEHDDLLPKYICKKCLQNLNAAYDFKIHCEFMDRQFREAFAIGLRKHAGVKAKEVRTSSSFDEYSSDFTDLADSAQTTMNDFEALKEESYNKPTTSHTIDPLHDFRSQNQNNQVANLQLLPFIKQNSEITAMDISPRSSEIGRIDSFGTKNLDDLNDQDMLSLKSERISSPKLKSSFKCDNCNARFSARIEYAKHLKTHPRYQCKFCKEWFAKKYLLNAHMKKHGGSKSFECSSCQNRFNTQSNLDRHNHIHHKKESVHTCITCKKTFNQLSKLRLHQTTHAEERDFGCDLCNSKFKSEVELKMHKKRHLPTEYRSKRKNTPPKKMTSVKKEELSQKSLSYKECGKRFSTLALLRSHSRCHSGEKKYECKLCRKRFSLQSALRSHIHTHTNEKRFKCDVCNVSFRQVELLKGHKLVHFGNKPHSCSVCGRAFALRSNLTIHMRTHHDLRPHHCDICPKKFRDSNALKRHHLMHQRTSQTEITIKEILEAPIVEASDGDEAATRVANTQPSSANY